MKLANALKERADLVRQMNSYMRRAAENTVVLNEQEPQDNPLDLIEAHHNALNRYSDLVFAINETNNRTRLSNGVNIASAIVMRDICKMEYDFYTYLADQARRNQQPNNFRYDNITLPDGTVQKAVIHKLVDVKEMERRANNAARDMREWDTMIQEANWTVNLIDISMTEEDFDV